MMQIAKPPDGFRVQCRSQAKDMAKRLCTDNPERTAFKNEIIERLRQTGHKEGVPLDWPDLPGARVIVIDNPPGLPEGAQIWIIYRTLGDTITFFRVLVQSGLQAVE